MLERLHSELTGDEYLPNLMRDQAIVTRITIGFRTQYAGGVHEANRRRPATSEAALIR